MVTKQKAMGMPVTSIEAARAWRQARPRIVERAPASSTHATRLDKLREVLLQLPGRLAAALACEADEAKCYAMLQCEVHLSLALLGQASIEGGGTDG